MESSQATTISPLAMGGRTIAAQAAFQKLGQVLVQVANTEARLRRIGAEIKKTARRVSALKEAVIPAIRSQIYYIQQVLDQQEQEDIFRLKRIKGKLEAKSREQFFAKVSEESPQKPRSWVRLNHRASCLCIPNARIFKFLVSETTHHMVIDHANGLHEGVTNRRPHELEPPLPQIPAHGFGLRSAGGYIGHPGPRVLHGLSPDKPPDVTVKAAELFLHLQEGLGVRDSCGDFAPVSDDLRIDQQLRHVSFGVSGDFPDIEIVESFSVACPLFKNGGPAQPGLRPLQNEQLEEAPVVVKGHAPFLIVIGLLQLTPVGPFASFHLHIVTLIPLALNPVAEL